MCMPKAPKIIQQVAPVPEVLPERQAPKAPNQAAVQINSTERQRRRAGYAALIHTPLRGLGAAMTTANYNATSAKQTLGGA